MTNDITLKNSNYLKKGIWLYFILLIFEGALRKWFLPGLASPLLLVRDPLALWLIYKSWKLNIFPFNVYVIIMIFLTVIAVSTSLIFGHGNLFVAIYGARILILHFPLIFVIGKVFTQEDVVRMGKWLIIIAIPMTVLIGLQFYSPQSAWVNRGVGGDVEGAGFSGALGYFRPPGTFSFTIGNVMFYGLVACYVFYFWLTNTKINRFLLITATIGLLASMSLSISRTLVFSIGITLLFAIISVASKPKFLKRMLLFIFLGTFVFVILSNTSFFQTATGAFSNRFESASETEGGVANSLFERFFGAMFDAIGGSNDLPFFGHGLGMGTNVGSVLLTGKATFLIAEWEWLRIVGEMGFMLGIAIIINRTFFCFDIFLRSYRNLRKGNLLPWLLLSFGLVIILQGQWAQPTVLGFSTLVGGLILAAAKEENALLPKTKPPAI